MAHGWCTDFFLPDDDLHHGSQAYMEILLSILDHVHHICQVTGRRFPQHLVLMSDNTVAQAKNQHVFIFLGLLVARRKFSTISLNFLMVGHTHEHIDQLFALFVEMVLRRHRFQSPKELAEAIDKEIGPVVREKGEECRVSEVKAVRDFYKWLSPLGVTPWKGFANRGGVEAAHSFTFLAFVDMDSAARLIAKSCPPRPAVLAGHGGSNTHDLDVYCLVKAYMRDTRPQQDPVLLLPISRARAVTQAAPATVLEHCPQEVKGPQEVKQHKVTTLMRLTTLRDLCRVPILGLFSAAAAIDELIERSQTKQAVPNAGRLAVPPEALPPVVSTANPIFPHLPEETFHMAVRFRRGLGKE